MESMNTTSRRPAEAQILREYGPATLGDGRVHGVTFDGKLVRFARGNGLVAFDPEDGRTLRKR